MPTYHPAAPEHFRQRNELLQKCLRPESLPFTIELEYPIVLAPEGREFSFCLNHHEQICSHVNLWPRHVLDRSGNAVFSLGLIGNVATDPALQGHGHMRNLLTLVEEEASRQGLAALVLWSDLSSFYHKLGYTSLGSEFRFRFLAPRSRFPAPASFMQCLRHPYVETSDELLHAMQKLRYPTPLSLERSQNDFRHLLAIPWLDLFHLQQNGRLAAYALVGKGYDMVGVVHEWGAIKPENLCELLGFIGEQNQLKETLVLSPSTIEAEWLKVFAAQAASHEQTPMALAKFLTPNKNKELDQLFIWGLDSI